MNTSEPIPDTALVDIKSSWASKINWTQIVGIAASVLALATAGRLDLNGETQAMIVLVIQAVVAVTTWVMKTWFTSTITTQSARRIVT